VLVICVSRPSADGCAILLRNGLDDADNLIIRFGDFDEKTMTPGRNAANQEYALAERVHHARSRTTDNLGVHRLTWVITSAFFLLAAYLLSNHEMWRDEIQAWLLARDSTSVPNLFANLKYEGHPALWYLLLMPLTRVSHSPTAMQALHLLIATSTIYLFTRYSPFSVVQKILFSFGYFPFYEYSIISRNYALGVLLIFVFCSLFERRYTNFFLIGLVLFLLCHTSVFALIIAIVVFFGLLLDFYFYQRTHKSFNRSDTYKVYVGFLIITLGIITAVLQLIPPSDSPIVGWDFSFDIRSFRASVLTELTAAYLPIPYFQLHFWDTLTSHTWNIYAWQASAYLNRLALLFVCSYLAFSMMGFVRKPFVFFLFAGCTFGLLTFFYVKYYGGIRHAGFLFIAFIMSAWLYRCREQTTWSISSGSSLKKWETLFGHSITLILLLHIGASFVAASFDYRYPFSMAKFAAEYISQRGLNNRPIVGYPDYATSAIVGYLGISQAYYPQGDRFGSYFRFDKQRRIAITEQEVVDKARQLEAHELTEGKSQGVLIILTKPLRDDLVQASKLQKIGEFTGAIVPDENFYIYLFE